MSQFPSTPRTLRPAGGRARAGPTGHPHFVQDCGRGWGLIPTATGSDVSANISALTYGNKRRCRAIPIEDRLPFGYQLRRAQYAYRLALDRALEATGVTTPQFALLAALETTPGLSNAELARVNLVTPQTMNAIVQKLEDVGLIVRRPDPNHGRILTAHLTPAGQNVLNRCAEHAATVEACMLGPLNAQERARLLDALHRAGDALASMCAGSQG